MAKSITLLLASNGMGNTPENPLKEKFAGTFLQLLQSADPLPKTICFYTEAVKMACDGSPFIEQLKFLEEKGVRLILCQTCLTYFRLLDNVKVGIVGGMADIMTAMWDADSVITL